MFHPEDDEIGALFLNLDISGSSKAKKLQKKKIGHLRVDPTTGQTTYKKTPASVLSRCIQKGISFSIGDLTQKPNRDVLLQDFQVVETVFFPKETLTVPSERQVETFTFKTYAPTAFKYFRDLFGIPPDSFMLSINEPLREVINPGASGSLFFVTNDDSYIIKTVQRVEAKFLQKLLPGYYMNLVQNPRTLLPKFYGLYSVKSKGGKIRIVVMNNLLPSKLVMHLQFDLKGSTHKRRASPVELLKKNPVYKDLDLLKILPRGILLEPSIYSAFLKTLKRDCLVLESFRIMDYSLLFAIHNINQNEKRLAQQGALTVSDGPAEISYEHSTDHTTDSENKLDNRRCSVLKSSDVNTAKRRYTRRKKTLNACLSKTKFSLNLDFWSGGIPATNTNGDQLLVFCGIIDILQNFGLSKRLEFCLKSLIVSSKAISVNNPSFYGKRFQEFMEQNVFRPDSKKQPKDKMMKTLSSNFNTNSKEVGSRPSNSSRGLNKNPSSKSGQLMNSVVFSPISNKEKIFLKYGNIYHYETTMFQNSHPYPVVFDVAAHDAGSMDSSFRYSEVASSSSLLLHPIERDRSDRLSSLIRATSQSENETNQEVKSADVNDVEPNETDQDVKSADVNDVELNETEKEK